MFEECYSLAKEEERVKYGVMNLFNDLQGIRAYFKSGSSFMVLNKSVRTRCTAAKLKKSGLGYAVSTLNYCYPLLT